MAEPKRRLVAYLRVSTIEQRSHNTVQEALLGRLWLVGHAGFTSLRPTEVMGDDPDGPMRTARREMAGVFAGLECRMIAKQVWDGRRAKAAVGHATGATTYGRKSGKRSPANPNGALVSVPAEQAALRHMCGLRAGGASTHQIAHTITDEGHPTQRGGRWSSAKVSRTVSPQDAAEAVSA
ncbi:hypothetical protein LAUMK191_04479 [Mycobacterium attenuatum]|uniref:recombinase family protein n=1 Tax=Mycobacterium attenuatum TaxID=2341086 RepID=UPI000F02BC06|nr:recombinase family protein [Mycobacterium attenuatum]VBA58320.1 hypothetical protein LAUMK191_04479 [Mycobacterium attenuatum]